MRNVLFQIHWFLGITAGVVLAVVGLTGGLMSFERPIMNAISPSIVQVEVSGTRLTPDAIAERFSAQRDGARVTQHVGRGLPSAAEGGEWRWRAGSRTSPPRLTSVT